MEGITRLVDRQWHNVELNVWTSALGILGAGRAANLACSDCQRTRFVKEPGGTHLGELRDLPDVIIERNRFLQTYDRARLIVVLKVSPDFRRIMNDRKIEFAEQIGGSNSGELKNLRRLNCASRKDNLPLRAGRNLVAASQPLDADGHAPLEEHSANARIE